MIPQYCTAHPVLRIITRNWQQNLMTAFLAGKLAREKNRRLGKAWLGKRGGNLWQIRKRKLSELVEIIQRANRYSRKRAQNRYSNTQIMTTKTTTLLTNALHPHCLNCVICPQILYDIVISDFSTCQVFSQVLL